MQPTSQKDAAREVIALLDREHQFGFDLWKPRKLDFGREIAVYLRRVVVLDEIREQLGGGEKAKARRLLPREHGERVHYRSIHSISSSGTKLEI